MIRHTDYDRFISEIRNWNGSDVTIFYQKYDPVYYYSFRVYLGNRGNFFAYVDKELHGRHPNYAVDLSKNEIHRSVKARTQEDLISEVLRILR